ncbi:MULTISPECIES: hypothetical protein [Kyrpidia]|nr:MULTISPECIES: hypothetical protein [Kyrpidia]MCL6575267.1 hypothetical protein [Kyrpidia sp.]HHY66353.1 hypothetical protein [Alicyclobacillus sp.]
MVMVFGPFTRWAIVFLIIFVLFFLLTPFGFGYGGGSASASAYSGGGY